MYTDETMRSDFGRLVQILNTVGRESWTDAQCDVGGYLDGILPKYPTIAEMPTPVMRAALRRAAPWFNPAKERAILQAAARRAKVLADLDRQG